MVQLTSHKSVVGEGEKATAEQKARNVRVIRRIGFGIRADAIKGRKGEGRILGFVGKEPTLRRSVWGTEKRKNSRKRLSWRWCRETPWKGEVQRQDGEIDEVDSPKRKYNNGPGFAGIDQKTTQSLPSVHPLSSTGG
ncbi:hypothetical protein GH714_040622 [Hevea brasiliensis]|uniref:Uncharacterized protein n=1 Tax=Hevea brasiliensis TaxID=3981 RepID=A0A6A6KYR1_HEVBR|nr:hypothetical protein GH714_040622 [Hevea brasiliensis]